MATVDLDTVVEMYLKQTSTGIYDWVKINRSLGGMVVQRSQNIMITEGNQNLNTDTGVPSRCQYTVFDPNGHLNQKNPMGLFLGSIGRGTQTRVSVDRVDDQAGRTVADTNWGSIGNVAGDTWTAGTSSGGTISASNWSVQSGYLQHTLPVANAYRLSELSKSGPSQRLFINVGVLYALKSPTSNVTGTGALASEVWLRTVDISNFLAVSVAYQINETIQLAIYDRTAGVNRYLLNYTTISGLSLSSTVDYYLRCHVEGGTVRAKIWAQGSPEPQGWHVTGSDAVIREGYLAVADYAFSGNTNTFPMTFQHDFIKIDIPVFFGEIENIVPSGDGKSSGKFVDVSASGVLDTIITSKSPSQSAIRRSRSGSRGWLVGASLSAASGDTRTYTVLTSTLGTTAVGDFFFLNSPVDGLRKEDTRFTITAIAANAGSPGTLTDLTFTPDARDAVAAGDTALILRNGTSTTQPIAYWPMEDGTSATQISSGRVNGSPMSIQGQPDFGANNVFVASAPILNINDAELTAVIPDYVDPGVFTVTFLLSMPDTDEAATGTDLVQFYTTGTGYSYDLRYTATGGGSLQLLVFNSSSTLLYDTGSIDFSMRGSSALITLVLKQVGGTVTYTLYKINQNPVTIGGTGPTTVTGVTTLGKITQIRVNPAGGYDQVGFGHLTVVPDEWTYNVIFQEFVGWTRQTAISRYMRLCYEINVPFTYRSSWDVTSTRVGAQKVDKLGTLFKQPAESDAGFLICARAAHALEYITRGSLVGAPVMATFDYSAGQVKDPFDPTTDKTYVENQVTVRRIDGTTAISELTAGALSTQEPPNGIRVREGGYDLSLVDDTQAQTHSDWRLGAGTIDQYRVPELRVTPAGVSAHTVERILSLGVGMRVDISNLSGKNIYDTMQQVITGAKLSLGKREYPVLSMVTQPSEVYTGFALTGGDNARPGMTDSRLNTAINSSYTGSVSITSDAGYYLITTQSSDFPMNIMIEGEEITLSSVSGDVSPQTGVISARGVNGVSKSHTVGELIQLYRPNRHQFKA